MTGSTNQEGVTGKGKVVFWTVAALMLTSTVLLSSLSPALASMGSPSAQQAIGFEHRNAVGYLA